MKKTITLLAVVLFTTTIFAQVPSYVTTTGLVGWFPFTGNVIDQSASANNGTVNGATLATDRFSSSNCAYTFGGVSSYIDIGNSTSLNFTNAISVSAWIKTSNLGSDMKIIEQVDAVNFWANYQFYISTTGQVGVGLRINTTTTAYTLSTNVLNTGQWHHVAFSWSTTINSGMCKIYIDGVEATYSAQDPLTTNVSITTPESTKIGADIHAPFNAFDGEIDDIGIWNVALNQLEITNLYNSSSVWLPCASIPTVTYGSQTYNTIQIGTQCWFKENLNIGVEVADVTQETNNSTVEKTCYNSTTGQCSIYGGIYNWDEAMNYGTNPQGICPTGWHIPTQTEWLTLTNYLGAATAGQQMKVDAAASIPWDGNNTSNFTALSGGIGQGSSFMYQGSRETYWSSTEFSATDAYDYGLTSGLNTLDEANNTKPSGYCIRCIYDLVTSVSGHSFNENILIYPNPSNGEFKILLPTDNAEITITNTLGQQILKAQATQKTMNLQLNENGIYIVYITTKQGTTARKLIVNR